MRGLTERQILCKCWYRWCCCCLSLLVGLCVWQRNENKTRGRDMFKQIKWRQIIWQCFNMLSRGDAKCWIEIFGMKYEVLLSFDVLFATRVSLGVTLCINTDLTFTIYWLNIFRWIIKLTFSVHRRSGTQKPSKFIIKDRTINFVPHTRLTATQTHVAET